MAISIQDPFSRTLASSWGATPTGQAWSTFGAGGTVNASDWSVNGTAGLISVPVTIASRLAYLAGVNETDIVVTATVSVAALPTGGPVEPGNIALRGTGTSTYYLCRVQIDPAGKVTALIFAPGGAQIGAATAAVTYTAGMKLRVTAMAVGPTIRVRVSNAALAEPEAWTLIVADGTYTGPGWVGLRCGVAAGNTNVKPIVFTLDDFAASTPVLTPFPANPLDVTVEYAFGADLSADPSTWVYTDCTGEWQPDRDLAATIGGADGTSKPQTGKLSLWMKNPNGDWTKGNSLSKYWPYIRRNTPIRVTLDPNTGSVRQYVMYATDFQPKWGDSGKQPLVQVTANGVRRRLDRDPPLQSPLYRAITARPELRAYWSMEDGSGATSAASAISGGSPMAIAGLNLATDSSEPGSLPLPAFTGSGTVWGPVSGPFGGHWQTDWYYKISDPAPTAEPKIMTVFTSDVSGAAGMGWDVQVGGAFTGVMTVRAYNSLGTKVVDQSGSFGGAYFGQWVHARLMTRQNGPSIQWQLVVFPLVGSGSFFGGTVAGTVGGPTAVAIAQNAALNGMSLGHIAVLDAWDLGAADAAQSGFTGELVTTRLSRLCADAGLPITIIGTTTTRMGPQRAATPLDLLDDCADTDGGILLDGLNPGWTYITRSAAYNLPVSLTADMAQRQVRAPFEPQDDDSQLVNDQTVSRVNGSSARYVDENGPAGTKAIKAYEGQPATLNIASDDDLPGQASWRVHVGTAGGDQLRFPAFGLDLHTPGGSALIEAWLRSRVRTRAQIANPPPGYGPAGLPIDLLIEGYTEKTRSRRTWQVGANTSPYAPWIVWQHTSLTTGRVNSSASTVRTTVPAGASSLQVNVGGPLLWTTNPAKMPLDLNIDGIRVRATAISGASSPQTFTVDPATVTKPLTAGKPVRLWQPAIVGL